MNKKLSAPDSSEGNSNTVGEILKGTSILFLKLTFDIRILCLKALVLKES